MWWEFCVHTYVNGKMRPVETIPGMGEERSFMEGVNSTITYCKNMSQCTPSTSITL
jgi:hypothetical protein